MGSLEHGTFDTKLHEAVRYGDIEAVKVALQQGYDPNLIGLYQWSAVHEASHNGEEEILALLLKHKGDPDKPDSLDGFTACHYAAKAGHVDCLKLLLEKGGHWNIKNKQGETTLDVTAEECRDILKAAKLKHNEVSQTDVDANESKTLNDVNSEVSTSSEGSQLEPCSTETGMGKEEKSKEPVLGYLHLTFEYHAKKSSLKIRVWQVTDLLLPPPTTSMIHSIYVKSYLMPDKKKNSKRKTEEIRVESTEAHLQVKKGNTGYQHIYSPTTFKFTKPLEYTDISSSVVKEKSVQLEVCITQKYSKRSFLIGQYHMPLKAAIRKLVRTSYPLIPCMNHTIPTNMKVYFASDLQISNSTNVFYSNPNIRNLSHTDMSEGSERALSELELTGVTIEDDQESLSDYTVVKVKDYPEDSAKTTLKRVTILDDEEIIPDSSKVNMNNLQSAKLRESEVNSKNTSGVVNLSDPSSHSQSAFSRVSVLPAGHKEDKTVVEVPEDLDSMQETTQHKRKYKKDKNKQSDNSSRPETPTWDYYDFDTGTSVVEIPFEDVSPSVHHSPAPVCLPMVTTMGLQAERRSQRQKFRKDKKEIDQGSIPTIVITQDDGCKSGAFNKTKKRQLQQPKKFAANVTPRDVEIEVDDLSTTPQRKGKKSNSGLSKSQIEVKVDVHTDTVHRVHSDTSIEIEADDSFVVDLEEMSEDFEAISQNEDNSVLKSKLMKQQVPMSVFIDETYDSSDDFSVIGEKTKTSEQKSGNRRNTKHSVMDDDLEVIQV